MVHQSSRLCTIPSIILEHIALEVALLDPLGPPAHLIPLLQTCKHVNAVLSHVTNNALYGAIFTLKFDKRAANRRLGEEAVYSSNLSSQLRKQCIALRRIRSGDISSPFIEEDFWTAFIMMLENDGKNAAQLLEYAKLDALVEQFLHTRLWEGREQSSGWPAESTANALAVWLCWMCIDQSTSPFVLKKSSHRVPRSPSHGIHRGPNGRDPPSHRALHRHNHPLSLLPRAR